MELYRYALGFCLYSSDAINLCLNFWLFFRFYTYHYGPFASDFRGLSLVKVKSRKGMPFAWFDQLMGVLPLILFILLLSVSFVFKLCINLAFFENNDAVHMHFLRLTRACG